MGLTFADVVDNVQQLSPDEKTELKRFLESYIIQERRREIYENCEEGLKQLMDVIERSLIDERRKEILKNGEEARRAYKNGELKAYTNVDDLMKALNDQSSFLF